MNLRSGEITKPENLLLKKKKGHRANMQEITMTDKEELHQLFADLKTTFTKEITEFRDEFKAFQQDTKKDIKTIMEQTADLRHEIEKTAKWVDHLETRVSALDDAENVHQKQAKQMKTRMEELADQMDYLENKSRQNSICIYNVKEKSEGSNMTAFLQTLITNTLEVPGEANIIRAHRVGKEQTNFSRPIIAAFFSFDTKKRVLKDCCMG